MKNTTRKHIWPMSLVMGLAVIGALAVIVALTALPGAAQAQDGPSNPFAPPAPTVHTVNIDGFSSSPSGKADLNITVNGPALPISSSIILVLDDKFQVPDGIPLNTVFVAQPTGPSRGAWVYAAASVDSEDDDLTGDDSHTIRVYIPDMDPADDSASGTVAGTFAIRIPENAGIKNPTEGTEAAYKIGYQLLTPVQSYEDVPTTAFANAASVKVDAKASLDDEKDDRYHPLVITGTGFNNGRTATAYVLDDQSGDAPDCATVVSDGESIGSGTVGGDHGAHKVVIELEEIPTDDFSPGATNYICIRDNNSPDRRYSVAAKLFNLEHTISISPESVNSGDEVTIKLRDYPDGATITNVSLDGKQNSSDGDFDIDRDGSEITFDMPGGVSGDVEVAVLADGASEKTGTITVEASTLKLSKSEVIANESIIVEGSGFDGKEEIPLSLITLDDEELDVEEAGAENCRNDGEYAGEDCIQIDSNGRFVIETRIWTVSDGSNPALDADTYTLKVKDSSGFEGKAEVTILEPTIMVSPETAGPRDYITISGTNWPQSTEDADFQVRIRVDGRNRTETIDTTGRFRHQVRLSRSIALGEEHDVNVTCCDGGDDIDEDATFMTPDSGITVTPSAARPGENVTADLLGMPVLTAVDDVRIGGQRSLPRNVVVYTDRDGSATVSEIRVPPLDPGFYSVRVEVGGQTAVAQLEILDDAIGAGAATALPDAVSDLGDNLEAIFHFNNGTKEWTFFDPRPEFAELNTLNELITGQPYWVLIGESQEDVEWNGRLVNFTCAADDCWNLEIW